MEVWERFHFACGDGGHGVWLNHVGDLVGGAAVKGYEQKETYNGNQNVFPLPV